jgi:hypothetical protein
MHEGICRAVCSCRCGRGWGAVHGRRCGGSLTPVFSWAMLLRGLLVPLAVLLLQLLLRSCTWGASTALQELMGGSSSCLWHWAGEGAACR